MDKIIDRVKEVDAGYTMGAHVIKILCYADDAVIMGENEDDVQRLLFAFTNAAESFNMQIATEKTKCLTVSKTPLRCKLVVHDKPIEQVMCFKYLGVNITSCRDLRTEIKGQANKASLISGCLRGTVWKNKYLSTAGKVKIYKACMRPVLTYALECRADTSTTKQLLRTTEMRTLRQITGKTLRDRIRSADIRKQCDVQDVVRWARRRRRGWREHVERMDENRLAKIAYNNIPQGRRLPGRPPKRWRECWTSQSQEGAV
ncbi:uncharacterized protein LOC129618927 [Condylostylus longicornis]|uniref:uncharacterized protein LOC129618927 n=1 Tax=Condylostylus longicornis TaxID=2530218 RepID=UPI00244E5A78|nr:uncharacterized protein LOC129618927 [Condylostylus longicornis]